MSAANKRLLLILLSVESLLLIPLLAMQFRSSVNWSSTDFLIAGILLLGTGLVIELVIRKVKHINNRLAWCITVIAFLLLLWAELGVGIFGTPLAGS